MALKKVGGSSHVRNKETIVVRRADYSSVVNKEKHSNQAEKKSCRPVPRVTSRPFIGSLTDESAKFSSIHLPATTLRDRFLCFSQIECRLFSSQQLTTASARFKTTAILLRNQADSLATTRIIPNSTHYHLQSLRRCFKTRNTSRTRRTRHWILLLQRLHRLPPLL